MTSNYRKNNKCEVCESTIQDYSKICRFCYYKTIKGRKRPPRTKEHIEKLRKANVGKKHTQETKEKMRQAHRKRVELGLNNFFKDSKSYAAVHLWLRDYYPKLGYCEECGTTNAKRYEWALKVGKEYEKKRENFDCLCVRCHRERDGTFPHLLAKKQSSLKENEWTHS